MNMEMLLALFHETFGKTPEHVAPLAGAGSNRTYYRLRAADGRTAIGVVGKNRVENRVFVHLAHHLRAAQLPAPEIYAVAPDEAAYLQEDFGDCSLYEALAQGRKRGEFFPHEKQLLRRAVRLLPHIQIEGGKHLEVEKLLPPVEFNQRAAMFDLNYFKYCFLRPIDFAFDEVALEDEFERFATDLANAEPADAFLYRDFQARNIMIVGNQPHLIDFQGGMRGPIYYDLASFLWQASANYPPALRAELIDEYLNEIETLLPLDRTAFERQLHRFVLFRLLQVLGAYGLRGLFERKPYFLRSIPLAIDALRHFPLAEFTGEYPTLTSLCQQLGEEKKISQIEL